MFTDIHGHYAWGVDDGIATIEEARETLENAIAQNMDTIVATPHFTSGFMTSDQKTEIKKRIKELKQLGQQLGITVYEGSELMLDHNSHDAIEQGLYLPIENTHYLLCEANMLKSTDYFIEHFEGYLRSVMRAGYTPIIAHIERYFHEEVDLDYVQFLIDMGCVIQVNTTNVLGIANKSHHKNAITLLDHNMVHCVATDTHRKDGLRCPNMQDTYNYMVKRGFGKEYALLVLRDNPQRLLHNEAVINPNFKRSFFSKLFR